MKKVIKYKLTELLVVHISLSLIHCVINTVYYRHVPVKVKLMAMQHKQSIFTEIIELMPSNRVLNAIATKNNRVIQIKNR